MRFRDKQSPSRLERRFELIWQAVGGPPLEREYRFHPTRRWRADFAHLPSKTLVEIEGAVFVSGRHTRGVGFVKDCEKYFAAWVLGWNVVRLVSSQLTAKNIGRIIQRITAE